MPGQRVRGTAWPAPCARCCACCRTSTSRPFPRRCRPRTRAPCHIMHADRGCQQAHWGSTPCRSCRTWRWWAGGCTRIQRPSPWGRCTARLRRAGRAGGTAHSSAPWQRVHTWPPRGPAPGKAAAATIQPSTPHPSPNWSLPSPQQKADGKEALFILACSSVSSSTGQHLPPSWPQGFGTALQVGHSSPLSATPAQ